ncbi:hypothetical protein PTNB73_05821 [Pyrenophora teres f. teres]|nr:hypothetical protein PTNB85_08237 [Pyrenophora teres f. teres]KAE8830209.1 hypothetical protein HRS9139_06833 [Pyrenophora teres f. teres]KAE8841449.1 hypothetical protein HRS9122_05575 [Pyrenophora teres f. teres]KAE8859552.1 hypothetical protein PTNB29_06783 [Pyrenophora teres f. teres]KAE8864933.1 hypothetical protein PTNB73_05821 [Pyrenophora teres f. teres]
MASRKKATKRTVKPSNPRKRHANLYDAIQGHVTRNGKAANASGRPLRPDEVLFRRKNAPVQYREYDSYSAHNRLPPGQELPDGGLTAALHVHISRLYAKTAGQGRQGIRKPMDETALIALGILMEETARGVLGETGDLAFTEATDKDEKQNLTRHSKQNAHRENKGIPSGVGPGENVGAGHVKFRRPRTLTSLQAPKTQPNPQKAASILTWFHKTAQAHSIKDLEKTLPQVSSINGMQVKDYLQALSDDNKIRVEKIGSGNWYWSFPADEKKAKDTAVEKAQDEYNKASATVSELQAKVDDADAARAEGEEMLMEAGGDRKTLMTKHSDLAKEVEKLRTELAAYSEQDPVEMEKKTSDTQQARLEAEKFTDQILMMQGWFKQQVGGGEDYLNMLKGLFGHEYDEEEQGLRELV